MELSEATKKLIRWIVTTVVGSLAVFFMVIEADHITEIISKDQGSKFAIGLFLMGELLFFIIMAHGASHKEEGNTKNEKVPFHWQFFGGLCASLALVAAAMILLSWVFFEQPSPQSVPEKVEAQIRPPAERHALTGERIITGVRVNLYYLSAFSIRQPTGRAN